MRRLLVAALAVLWASCAFAQNPVGATVSNPTYLPPTVAVPTTIANGTSLSGVVDLGQTRLFAIQTDTTAWTAAALTFQASIDGVNFYNLLDDTGTEVNWTVAAQQYQIAASPAKWQGIRYLKIRSGTSATPVNQGAARTLTVVGVP